MSTFDPDVSKYVVLDKGNLVRDPENIAEWNPEDPALITIVNVDGQEPHVIIQGARIIGKPPFFRIVGKAWVTTMHCEFSPEPTTKTKTETVYVKRVIDLNPMALFALVTSMLAAIYVALEVARGVHP